MAYNNRDLTPILPSSQKPLAEFVDDKWQIWLDYNRDRTAGTLITLNPDGTIEHQVISPTGEILSHKVIKS